MALFSDDMRTLAQNLLQDHDIRLEAVAGLRTNVRQELKNYRSTHQALTAEQEKALNQHMDDLHSQVNNIRQAATTFLGNLDKSNQSMVDELSLQLTGQRSRLAKDTAAFLKATDAAHRSMATAQKQSMVKGRNQLMAEVTATREKNQTEQSAVRTDQAKAAKIWANISQLKQKNRMKKGPATYPQAAESAWRVASPAEPSGPDDFKVIRGIGPSMAKYLYTAGISSFAQLAASTPEQLRQVLGKAGELAKVETWITQAQDLIR